MQLVAVKAGGNRLGPLAGSIASPNTSGQAAIVEVAAADAAGLAASQNDNDAYQYQLVITTATMNEKITPWKGPLILSPNLFA